MSSYRVIMSNGASFDISLKKGVGLEGFVTDLGSARWKIIGSELAIQTSQIVAIVPGEQLISKENGHD